MLTLGIIGFVVKIVKEENDVTNILPQCSNVFTSFVFIELFNSSSSDDLTTLVLLTKSPKSILQLATWLSPQPFNPMGSIQSIVFCLCVMVLLGHLTSCKI
jgi:hypothetical protein